MAMSLHEYCLHHVNTFLKPHDWVQLSRVCQFWKLATLKSWKSITEIKYEGCSKSKDSRFKDETTVSAVDFGKMLLYAAPFVKVLRVIKISDDSSYSHHFLIGHHRYKVENLRVSNVLKLLAKKSTELTEIYFDYGPPEVDLIRPLFETNDIKKYKVRGCNYDWYQNVRVHEIEELDLKIFNPVPNSASYQGCFPELRKLKLELQYSQLDEDPRKTLSQILPHVLGLKSLSLTIYTGKTYWEDAKESYTLLFSDVTKLSELEELSLNFDVYWSIESSESFINQLSTCCPKLRVLKISNHIDVEEATLLTLLTLPQIESLKFTLWDGFPNIELPEVKHLTELTITIFGTDPPLAGLYKAVKKMPCLKKLIIEFEDGIIIERESLSKIDDSVLLNFICGVVIAATSLGKDVLVSENLNKDYISELMITKSNNQEAVKVNHRRDETLELLMDIELDEPIVEAVRAFVRNKLYRYNTILLKSKNERPMDEWD